MNHKHHIGGRTVRLPSIDRALTIPSTVIYANGNSGRGLLDRNISEEHPQSSNESIKTKTRQKNDKKKREQMERKQKSKCQNKKDLFIK